MKRLFLAFLLLLFSTPMWAQVYTVTGNVVDSDGQQWIGGSYQITLVNQNGLPNFYCTSTGTNFPASFGGTLDGTGSFSVQLTSTACVIPKGSLWKFQVCPDVTGAACGTIQIPITQSGSISSQINAVILAPRVTGGPGINAYSDTEVSAFAPNTYFNVISQVNRCYSTSWAVCGGGGGGSLPTASGAGQAPVSTGPGTTYTAQPVIASSSYTAGTGGVTANTLVMGDGSGNVIPFVNSATSTANYGKYVGVATATATVGNPAVVANTSGQLAACQFDGTPAVGDIVIGSTSTPGECHDQGGTGTLIVTPYMPVVGWVNSVSGTVGTVRLAGLGVWGSGNILTNNGINTQTMNGGLINPQTVTAQTATGPVFDVDGFTTSNGYTGIGVAQTAWTGGVYAGCTAVSYSGGNYIAANRLISGTTPGTNSAIWYPVPNANTPTALDCAFYFAAAATVNAHTGADVRLGVGTYNACIDFKEPTVPAPAIPSVSIHGIHPELSKINQTCDNTAADGGDGLPMLEQPDALTQFYFAQYEWEDFALYGNSKVDSLVGVYGSSQFSIKRLQLQDAAPGSDHYIEFGDANGNYGWTFEASLEDINLNFSTGHGSGAVIAVTVSGGVPSFTVSNGGSGYQANSTIAYLWGANTSSQNPCTSMGTTTPTIVSGAITAVSSTATGCGTNTFAVIYPGVDVNYGYKFTNMSDSHMITGLGDGGVGQIACIYTSNVTSNNNFYKSHPTSCMVGVEEEGNNNWFSTQFDTNYKAGFEFNNPGSTTNTYGAIQEWAVKNMSGYADYWFPDTTSSPSSAPNQINIYGDICSGTPPAGYTHFLASYGNVETAKSIPYFATVWGTQYCDQGTVYTTATQYVGNTFNMSNGTYGDQLSLGLSNFGGGLFPLTATGSGAAGVSLDAYTLQLLNSQTAISTQSYRSPAIEVTGSYYNGSAAEPFGVQLQDVPATPTGTSTTVYHRFSTTGTPPAHVFYEFDNPIESAGYALSGGASPTIVAGAAAGSSPTCTTVAGFDTAGSITCTTGTATTTGILLTVTFSTTQFSVPHGCQITAQNAASAPASAFVYTTVPNSSGWSIDVAGTALTTATQYQWSYLCL